MSENTEVMEAVEENETELEASGLTVIKATSKDEAGNKIEASFEFDFTESAMEAVEMFGDAVVHERFIRAAKIEAQQRIRELLNAGKSPEDITEHMTATWHPGASSQNPEIAVMNAFANMSQEERDALIAKLTAQSSE